MLAEGVTGLPDYIENHNSNYLVRFINLVLVIDNNALGIEHGINE